MRDGSRVGIHYDALLAKVIAHAPTREEAAARLAAALFGAQIHGLVTNRDLLVGVLRDPDFLAGAIDTAFLEQHSPAELAARVAGDGEVRELHAVAAAYAGCAERRRSAAVLSFAPPGWRNNPSQLQESAFVAEGDGGRVDVAYGWRRSDPALRVNGTVRRDLRACSWTTEAVVLERDGVRHRCSVHRVGSVYYVDSPLGHSVLEEVDRFPVAAASTDVGSLLSPMPGLVSRVAVQVGDRVVAGSLVAVVEAMKMEHRVTAARPSRVTEVCVKEGQTVAAGAVLAVLEPGLV